MTVGKLFNIFNHLAFKGGWGWRHMDSYGEGLAERGGFEPPIELLTL
jgi:hypothetical protein